MAHTQIGVSEDRDDEFGDWLDAFRRATAGLRSLLVDRATTRDREPGRQATIESSQRVPV